MVVSEKPAIRNPFSDNSSKSWPLISEAIASSLSVAPTASSSHPHSSSAVHRSSGFGSALTTATTDLKNFNLFFKKGGRNKREASACAAAADVGARFAWVVSVGSE